MTMPEEGRQAAHVLLDVVSAYDNELPEEDPANAEAMNLALLHLNQVGAVTATFNDDTDEVTIDMSNLVGGVAVTLSWLVHQLAGRLTPHQSMSSSRYGSFSMDGTLVVPSIRSPELSWTRSPSLPP